MSDQDQVDIGDDINERELSDHDKATYYAVTGRFDRDDFEPNGGTSMRHLLNEPTYDARGAAASRFTPFDEYGVDPTTTEATNPPMDDGPTPQALAGALFAQLGYVVSDLGEAETMAVIVDGDRETLAVDLAKLDTALQQLGVIRDEIAQALAAQMENELEAIAGYAVKRTKSDKVEWDRDAAWTSVRAAIIDQLVPRVGATEAEIGERIEVIDRTLHGVKVVYTTLNPTVKGLLALAVNPYELRSTTPATRWTVRVTT